MQFTITSTISIYAHPSYFYSTWFLVVEFFAIIFLHNCVYHGLWFRHGLIFMVSILRICESVKLKWVCKDFYVISVRTFLTCYFNYCLLNLYIDAQEISQGIYVVSDGFTIHHSLLISIFFFLIYCRLNSFY